METGKENDRVDDMVIEEAKRRKLPPSRVRYEKTHPVVSIRLRQEDKAKLLEMSEKTGKSPARLVQEALDLFKRDIEAAYNEGYKDGWGCFEIPCKVCGKNMPVDINKNEGLKQVVLKACSSWGHHTCFEKKRQEEELEGRKQSHNNL
jgi:hypothetical protein